MITPRARHAVADTSIAGGAVMILGGQSGFNTNTVASVDLFDPATNGFSAIEPMQLPRYNLTATLLPDTRVLVAGGIGDFGNVAGGELSKPTYCGPTITALTPSSGTAGTTVTIGGTQFDGTQNASTVSFNGVLATATSWSETSIVTTVPAGASTGPLVVIVNGRASNGPTFVVVDPSPDLVESVKNPPPEVIAGRGSFTVADRALNQGTLAANPSTTRFYLSANTVKDRNDVLLTGTRAVPALAPGAYSTGTTTVTVPTMAPGKFYLLACADDLGVVAEGAERNNCVASTAIVAVR
jgi:hypothetical protein